MRRPSRDEWAALGAVGFALAAQFFIHSGHPYSEPVADALSYTAAGHALAEVPLNGRAVPFEWGIGSASMRGFTYPVLFALVLRLGGSTATFAWLQGLVMVPATIVLLFLAGRAAFSARIGAVAAWLYALWIPIAVYTGFLMQETLLSLLMALTLWVLALVVSKPSVKRLLGLGLCFGIMAVTHSAYQYVGLVTLGALMLMWGLRRESWRRAGLVVAAMALVLVPISLGRIAFDLPGQGEGSRGYGGGGGWTFWAASNVDTDFIPNPAIKSLGDLNSEEVRQRAIEAREGRLAVDRHMLQVLEAKLGPEQDTVISDRQFYQAGIQNLLDHPESWPRKATVGISNLLRVPADLGYYGPAVVQWPGPWQTVRILLTSLALVGLLMVGLKRRDRLILFVPMLSMYALLLIAMPERRHSIPMFGSEMLLVAFAMVYPFERNSPDTNTQSSATVTAVTGQEML